MLSSWFDASRPRGCEADVSKLEEGDIIVLDDDGTLYACKGRYYEGELAAAPQGLDLVAFRGYVADLAASLGFEFKAHPELPHVIELT